MADHPRSDAEHDDDRDGSPAGRGKVAVREQEWRPGQQQRAALARCLAVDPKVLLLDEPFGALDKNLRLDMQIEVKRLQRQYGITTILVTHDQEEALSMADRIAVMSRGRRGGHVGIITGIDASGNPIMISGNNGNRVREAPVSRGRIYAYVMPTS